MVPETRAIEAPGLRCELKARHPTMIAIGGSIGTDLFVASSVTIPQVGPDGALPSYMLTGLMVYFLMTNLGGLVTYMPISGSFTTYGQNYVEGDFGFALGWSYWYNRAMTIAVNLVAAQLVMNWRFPGTPGWTWNALLFGTISLLNYISARGFDRAEYWFSLIKVAAIIVFIIVGVLMIIGIFKGAQPADWSNWTTGEAPFTDGFATAIDVTTIVGFSFRGTELIGIVTGESGDPAKNIPRVVRQVLWRILSFYMFAVLIISLIIPYTDPNLLRNDVKDISVNPFALVFQYTGLLSAAVVMNVIILTAVLSTGNSDMYASTRMLYTLTCDGKASRIFVKLSYDGAPHNALYATTVIVGLCFLTSMSGSQTIYLWLLNTSGMMGFIAWLGIAISHHRFRCGCISQGHNINNLSYRSGFLSLGPIFAFILYLVITLSQNYEAFLKDTIDWGGIAATYIGIPLSLIIWFGYKLTKGIHSVRYSETKFLQNNKR